MKNALTISTSESVKPWGWLAHIIALFAPYHLFITAYLFCLAVLVIEVAQ